MDSGLEIFFLFFSFLENIQFLVPELFVAERSADLAGNTEVGKIITES